MTLVASYFHGERYFPLKAGGTLFVVLTLLVFAALDRRRPASDIERMHRARLALGLALCFAVITAAKSWVWHTQLARVEKVLLATSRTCIEHSDASLRWLSGRPANIVDTWALPSTVFVRQVGEPARYLLADGDCAVLDRTGEVKVDPWTTLNTRDMAIFTARKDRWQ